MDNLGSRDEIEDSDDFVSDVFNAATFKDAWVKIFAPFTKEDYARRPTRVLIHGWPGLFGGKADGMKIIEDAYKKHHNGKNEKNVVIVTWNPGSILFHIARNYCFTVAEKIARMLDSSLGTDEALWKNLTIVGHSIGSHIAGFVGQKVKNGKVGTIIALDPAGKKITKLKSFK